MMAKVKVPVPNPVYGEVYYEANFLQIAFCPDCEYGAWTVSIGVKLGDEVRLITEDDPRLFTLILPAGIKEVRPQSFARGQNVVLILENEEEVELEFVADESLWEKERAFIESLPEEDDEDPELETYAELVGPEDEEDEEELDMEALDMANDVMPPEDDIPPEEDTSPYDCLDYDDPYAEIMGDFKDFQD
ncbi:protein of unknown function (plasmid) [Thermococcus nautili]|nr:protein of unknown function [Thermococcus nautili]